MDTSGATFTDAEQRQVTAALLTLRIIAGALIMGVATFAAVTIFLVNDNPNDDWSLLFWLALGGTVLAIIMSQVMTAMVSRGAVTRDITVEKALAIYSQRVIVGMAILEGAAFFTLVIFLIEGQWLLLAATALLVVLMFIKFPSRGGLVRWIEERRQLAELAGNE